jgi:hypothetical protein
MVRRSLLLGVLMSLAVILSVAPNEHRETMLTVFAVGLVLASLEIASATTRTARAYGASGMVAGMAAMMAAMGTGLAAGYATGMIWSLGWANLVGVVVGFGHGLLMGRRYGPMAALDGAGGGVMGGLMGPMLGVMLLYQPTSLVLTALLMLALQGIFSVGGVYLVAAAAGAVGSSGLLYQVGRVLGAHYLTGPLEGPCAPSELLAVARTPARQPRAGARGRRGGSRGTAYPSRSFVPALVAVLAGALALVVVFGGTALNGAGGTFPSITRADSFAAAPNVAPVAATVSPDGVQQLHMTLQYPRYEPRLMEVKAGTPVQLSLEALGDPG